MRDFAYILPEIFLALTLAFVIVGEITYHGERLRLISTTAVIGLAAALVQALIAFSYGPAEIFSKTLSIDGLTFFFRSFFILLAIISVVMSTHSREISGPRHAEYIGLILAATIGMSLAASSADLLLTFLALQLVNVVSFFLAGYSKRREASNEAGLKYMITGSVVGGLFIYGLVILFGSSKALNIFEIHKIFAQTPMAHSSAAVAFVLIFTALSFQIGSFPMYFWAPDVIQGAPTPVSAQLTIGSRVAGFAVAIRLLFSLFAKPAAAAALGTGDRWEILGTLPWPTLLGFVAGVTMLLGAILALRQISAKRMISCLIISHTGVLILGLLVLDWVGVAALLYNLVVELFAIAGIFYVLSFVANELDSDRMPDLRGMLKWAPGESIALILFGISLLGLPPMPGFIGKFALIGAAVGQGWSVLSTIAVLSMALSTVAFARLSFCLVGDYRTVSPRANAGSDGESRTRKVFLLALLLPLLLSGIFAQQILTWAAKSISFILW